MARAIGVFTFVAVSGGTIGLLVGGVLTQAISWHWIFLVNLPIGVATFAAALLGGCRGSRCSRRSQVRMWRARCS